MFKLNNNQVDLLAALALVAAIALVYGQMLSHAFIDFDANMYLTSNPVVQRGLTWDGFVWSLTSVDFNWHPLTWWSHMLDVELYGMMPGGHYLTNLILHLLNTLLVYKVILLGVSTNESRPVESNLLSFTLALIFALHPLHVEPVVWLAARKDLLCTFFGLLSVVAYLRSVHANAKRWYYASILCFVLSAMSKAAFVSLPLLLLLLDYWPLRRLDISCAALPTLRRLVIQKIPFLLVSLLLVVATYYAQHHIGAVVSLERTSVVDRIAHVLVAYGAYLRSAFYPLDLSIFYPYQVEISTCAMVLSVLALLTGSGLAVRMARIRPAIPVGWGWFLISLVPMVGLVQIGDHAKADRYTYIPYVGLFLAVAFVLIELIRSAAGKRVLAGLTITLLVLMSMQSFRQVSLWRDSETIFLASLAVTQDNYVLRNNLGTLLAQRGDFNGALREFQETLRIKPSHVSTYKNLGDLFFRQGLHEQALVNYEKLLASRPDDERVLNNVGVLLFAQGRYGEAADVLTKAVTFQPTHIGALLNLARTQQRLGRKDEAVRLYRTVVALDPSNTYAQRQLGSLDGPSTSLRDM